MNKNAEVVRYYDEGHPDYFLVYFRNNNRSMNYGYWDAKAKNRNESLYRLYDRINEELQVKESDHILDAGCGFGEASFWFARNTGAHVTGITLPSSQVTGATELAKKYNLDSQVDFKQMDYTQTTFPDNTFDHVYAIETICHLYDKTPFYKEALRILKPGGKLVVYEYVIKKTDLNEKEKYLQKEWLDGWALGELWTTQKHQEVLASTGFSALKTEDCTKYTGQASHYLYNHSLIAIPVYSVLNKLGLLPEVRLKNGRACYYQWLARQAGLWGHVLLTATKPR